ncbi:MAG: hypothetical protein E3J29_00185 [Dehalococcoidia bacterium]|nr:MAG: hypothetical protein E3J29_00185 [Dehalococcoidia bacterium]
MKRAKNLKELGQQFDAIKSGVAGDTNFTAAALLWLCENRDGNERQALRKAIIAFTKEQRALRRELMAARQVEATLADRIGILESTAQLKELARQLGEQARQMETSEKTGKT